MKALDLDALTKEFQAAGLTELHVKTAEFELFLASDAHAAIPGSGQVAATVTQTPAAPPRPPASPVPKAGQASRSADAPETVQAGFAVVRAPYLGTFYRAPKPGQPNFVEIGDTVQPGADLCLVEVMKLFTAVRAETRGVVRQIFAVDGQMVAEGQALFALEPVA